MKLWPSRVIATSCGWTAGRWTAGGWLVRVGVWLGLAVSAVGQVRPRIVGGDEAPKGKYPWMVSVATRSMSSLYDAHFCGGVLVHPHWVLTAAHCVERKRASQIDVVVGAHNLESDGPPEVRRIEVREIVMHPDFDSETSESDVALLVLAEPVVDRPVLDIIDDGGLCVAGTEAVVLGWGATSGDGSNFPAALREVAVPIVALADANALPAFDGSLTDTMLPAGPVGGGRDSCQGDSGGPLVVAGARAGQLVAAGVVSFGADGLDCADPAGLGIYTRLTSFRTWIYDQMRPAYAAWEARAGVIGEQRTLPGDGRASWEAFFTGWEPGDLRADGVASMRALAPGDPLGLATLTFRRRVAAELRTRVFHSPTGESPWLELDVAALQVSPPVLRPGHPDVESITLRVPHDETGEGYFRLTGDTAPVYVAGPRPIALGQTLSQAVHLLDPIVNGRRAKEYQIILPEGAGRILLTARSLAFDMGMHLLNASTLEVLQSVTSNTSGSTDEQISFDPSPGAGYLVRVGPATGGVDVVGRFSLHCGLDAAPTALTLGSDVAGTLESADALNPDFAGEARFMDQFSLEGAEAGSIALVSLTSTDFAPLLSIRDAITRAEVWAGALEPGRSRVSFFLAPGTSYLVQVTSGAPGGLGEYALTSTSVLATRLSQNQTLEGLVLDAADLWDPAYSAPGSHYFKEDIVFSATRTDLVRARMTSLPVGGFDTFLAVYDAATGDLIGENDDATDGSFDSEVPFTAEAGHTYLLRCTSAEAEATGAFTIALF